MVKQYEIYHDESKEDAFWHIFLFVPTESKECFVNFLKEIKEKSKLSKMSFKDLSSDNSISFASYLTSLLTAGFQQSGNPPSFVFGHSFSVNQRHHQKEVKSLPQCLGLKVAILKKDNHHNDMLGTDTLSKIETTFRMGLQWACHYLFDESNPIEIANVFIDWFEHYLIEHKRPLDTVKIKNKLIQNSRNYLYFSSDFNVLNGQLDDNSLIIEAADIFLWAFRLGYLSHCSDIQLTPKQVKKLVTFNNIKPLVDRLGKWAARMANSKFNRFWCFSGCRVQSGARNFNSLIEDIVTIKKPRQDSLF